MTSRNADPRKTEVVPASALRTIVTTGSIIPATPEPLPDPAMPEAFRIGGHTYRVRSILSRSTGEGELYIVGSGTRQVVAKRYRQPGKQHRLPILEAIRRIRNKHLIEIVDIGVERSHLVEVMAHAGGGSLRELKPFRDPQRLRRIIVAVAAAIDALHGAGIVHCDVKPENILFMDADRTTPVLADFGIAEFLDRKGRATTEKKGSALYAAPEAQAVAENMIRVYPASDWYSLGITILDVWSAGVPFAFSSELDLLEVKMQGKIDPPADMPGELQALVAGLLFPIADSRWGYGEVREWAGGGTPDLPRVECGPVDGDPDTPDRGDTRVAPPAPHLRPMSVERTKPRDASVSRRAYDPREDQRVAGRKQFPTLPLVLCVCLGIVSVLSTSSHFPSELAGLNPLLIPLALLGGIAGVWFIQRGERGRLLSALVAGPIVGVVVGIAAFWTLSFAARVPFLVPVCCLIAGTAMVFRGTPGRGGHVSAVALFCILLLTYILHMPPVSTFTRTLPH